jgi:hypothetical protein
MKNLIIFLTFIYRLKLKVKAKNGFNIGWKGGDSFWEFLKAQVYAVKIRDLRHLRQRITDCCATVDPSMLNKIRTTW